MTRRKSKLSQDERNERKRKQYYDNRTTILEKQKQYYEENKQGICEKRRYRYKKKKAELDANPKLKQKIVTEKQEKELSKFREKIRNILKNKNALQRS